MNSRLQPRLTTPTLSQSPSSPPQKSSQAARVEQWIALAVLVVLISGCYLVLQPFLSAVLWAVILCCTTWPVFVHLQRITRGSVPLAASMVIVGISLAENANILLEQGKRLIDEGPPDPPAWVRQIPLIGERAQAYWASIAHDSASLVADLRQYLQPLRTFALASGAGIAQGVLQLTLSILIAFFLYRDGEAISERLTAS